MLSSNKPRALVLEPDRQLRKMLAELLKTHGHDVVQEADCHSVIARVIALAPDIVILTEDAVDEEGAERVRMMRRLMDGIIVVMGDGGEGEVVAALLEGADIYIRKPVNFRELIARVGALRRRIELDRTA